MSTYTITYTQSTCAVLDDDFTLMEIIALTYEDMLVIIKNITEYFGGTLIDIHENIDKVKRRKVTRREQRPKVSRHLCDRGYSW